jgi:AraC-like DNA-binding protein
MRDFSSRIAFASPAMASVMLQDLRTGAAAYCRTEVANDWAIALPFEHGVRFHFVARGQCWLRAEQTEPVLLEAGDLALLPHGVSHSIASSSDAPARPIETLGVEAVSATEFRLSLGPRGEGTLIQCVTLSFSDPKAELVIAAMPELLVIRRGEHDHEAVASLLHLMAAELAADRPGSDAIRARLADAVISMIVRNWAETSRDRPAWLQPDADRRILKAMHAIYSKPGKNWTIPELAAIAGMSRTLFIERFTSTMGMPPGRYMVKTRAVIANHLLRDNSLSLAQIAQRLGYSDATAFSRAYRNWTGLPPSAVRGSASARQPPETTTR